MYVCMYGKTGTKSDSMKIYKYEKTRGLQRMILNITNVKRFDF